MMKQGGVFVQEIMFDSWRKHRHYQIIHSPLTENMLKPVINNGPIYTVSLSYYI